MAKKHDNVINLTKVLMGLSLQCMGDGSFHPDVLEAFVTILDDLDDAMIELGDKHSIEDYKKIAMKHLSQKLENDPRLTSDEQKHAIELSNQLADGLFGNVQFINLERNTKWQM